MDSSKNDNPKVPINAIVIIGIPMLKCDFLAFRCQRENAEFILVKIIFIQSQSLLVPLVALLTSIKTASSISFAEKTPRLQAVASKKRPAVQESKRKKTQADSQE